jgi:hypothetical protein
MRGHQKAYYHMYNQLYATIVMTCHNRDEYINYNADFSHVISFALIPSTAGINGRSAIP